MLGVVQKQLLRGHHAQVTCLDHSQSASLAPGAADNVDFAIPAVCILSGSEDGTARLWDLRMQRAAVCIIPPPLTDGGGTEITSVAFHPVAALTPAVNSDSARDGNEGVCAYSVYVSTNFSQVLKYDLRSMHTSLIVKNATVDYTDAFQSKDEINQLSVQCFSGETQKTKRDHCWIAAADDFGDVRLIDELIIDDENPSSGEVLESTCAVLRHAQNGDDEFQECPDKRPAAEAAAASIPNTCNADDASPSAHGVAMVTSVIFRPNNVNSVTAKSPLFVASGGTDCIVRLWDARRPREPFATHVVSRSDTSANQVCNPPMVHSLSWSRSGRLLAAGLGDGSCLIFRTLQQKRKNRSTTLTLQPCGRLDEGHSSAVSCAHFPLATATSAKSADTKKYDRLLITAGNDGNVIFWDLGADIASQDATDPSAFFTGLDDDTEKNDVKLPMAKGDKTRTTNRKKKKERNRTKSAAATEPGILFGIPHGKKPNWIVCGRDGHACESASDSNNTMPPSSLFVADTSKDITVYTLPLR